MELVISSLGMVTSLGGVVAGSAAQRAGLCRPVDLGVYYRAENQNLYPFSGHRAIAPSGKSQVDCWREMASLAARELCDYGALPGGDDATFWRRTAVMAAMPILDSERFRWPPDKAEGIVRDELLRTLTSSLGLPVEPDMLFCLPLGHTATARALLLARRQCAGTRLDRVVIVAVDSLVHSQSLRWLHVEDRLKTRDAPTGLSPSEACACLLVERGDACAKRRGRAEAVVKAESFVKSREDVSVDIAMEIGRDLAQAIREALELASAPRPFDGDLYLDLNGEELCAMAWGHAQVRLHDHIDFARARVVLPCGELGDIGAASAAVAVGLGTRSFVRGYARGRSSLLCSVSGPGGASAILICPP